MSTLFLSLVAICAFPSEDDPCCVPKEPYVCPHEMCMAFDATGRRFVCANQRGELMLWEGAAEKPTIIPLDSRNEKDVFNRGPMSVALDGEGRRAVLFYTWGRIQIWDLDLRKKERDLKCGFSYLSCGRRSTDGRLIACLASNRNSKGESDKTTVVLWNASDWTKAGEIESPFPLDAICFSGDSHEILACGGYPTDQKHRGFTGVISWNVDTRTETGRMEYGSGFPLCIAASPDGRWIATGGGEAAPVPGGRSLSGHLRIFDWKSKQMAAEPYRLRIDYVRVVEFTPDGHRLISGAYVNGRTGECLAELRSFAIPGWSQEWESVIGDAGVHRMCVSPKSHAIIACEYNSMRVVDIEKGTVLGKKAVFQFDPVKKK